MTKDGRIWLSHSGISTLDRCPRCFWLQYRKKIRQPEGIVSRLANRFDIVLKKYFDIFRPTGELPPIVESELEGRLENPFKEKYFVSLNKKYGFWGKLDECLINDKGEHIPVDFKTSSSDPRNREMLSVYQDQVNAYLYLLSQNNKRITSFGYLIYFFPDISTRLHKGFPMIVYVKKVAGNPQQAEEKIQKAINVLEGKMPKPSSSCNFCNWFAAIKKEVEQQSFDYHQLTLN